MPPRQVRSHAISLMGARGVYGVRENRDKEDDYNHQESVMEGGVSALRGNIRGVGGAPPAVFGGVEFIDGKGDIKDEVINLVQGSMIVAQYEAKFTSLSRFAKAFMSTEEEKEKKFIRGLRPSITNKIAENLIKVYSTIVSSAAAIKEILNKTRKITNQKSQREGTRNQSEGCSFKKPNNSTAQQQYASPVFLVASSGQTSWGGPTCFGCHQLGIACLVNEGSIIGVALLPVICEFSDVFLEDLMELPPHREIEFSIDLIPGTTSISVPPYHFAPAELQELKIQIQNLLDMDFIRPSASPWGTSTLFAK
ncbi:hypothetical protein Acr_00g0042600 [Actinidia rufa]|uniref:Retrotransposon gag domain-containing protein n=1 Tax=Actinidia rufa TaxID=165716 RepID=A0A7J0DIF1_9ERIC|nr:hypothetical protein Acr_00g0042600 [Actinidia rufa]